MRRDLLKLIDRRALDAIAAALRVILEADDAVRYGEITAGKARPRPFGSSLLANI
jgi:hypothetical protein